MVWICASYWILRKKIGKSIQRILFTSESSSSCVNLRFRYLFYRRDSSEQDVEKLIVWLFYFYLNRTKFNVTFFFSSNAGVLNIFIIYTYHLWFFFLSSYDFIPIIFSIVIVLLRIENGLIMNNYFYFLRKNEKSYNSWYNLIHPLNGFQYNFYF